MRILDKPGSAIDSYDIIMKLLEDLSDNMDYSITCSKYRESLCEEINELIVEPYFRKNTLYTRGLGNSNTKIFIVEFVPNATIASFPSSSLTIKILERK